MKSRKPIDRLAAWLESARHLVDADWQRELESRRPDREAGREILGFGPQEPEPVEYRAASDPSLSLEDFISLFKVDPASIRWDGKTLAHAAAGAGDLEKLRWLVENGVDPNICGSHGDSPLTEVAQRRSPVRDSIIRYLLSIRACQGAQFALNLSLSFGRFEIAREQIAAGADPKGYRFSLLHQSAVWGNEKDIIAAIEQADDLEAIDGCGRTPWLVAVQAGRIEAADCLRDWGADTSGIRPSGASAMHFAAEGNHPELIQHLAAAGHEVTVATDSMGNTPLHTAAIYDSVDAAAALLGLGADIAAETKFGGQPIHQAGSVGMMEVLFTHGADLNRISSSGDWPLKDLTQAGNLPAVDWLLKHGAIVDNCQDHSGETALFQAVYHNHFEIASLLLERGANASAVDLDGDTPLSICRTPAMESLLLRYKAKKWSWK